MKALDNRFSVKFMQLEIGLLEYKTDFSILANFVSISIDLDLLALFDYAILAL